jgi:hypothetical protein
LGDGQHQDGRQFHQLSLRGVFVAHAHGVMQGRGQEEGVFNSIRYREAGCVSRDTVWMGIDRRA